MTSAIHGVESFLYCSVHRRFTGDGVVDAADYVVWVKTRGQSGTEFNTPTRARMKLRKSTVLLCAQ